MTGTERIRWQDVASSIDAIASRGYVGKLKQRLFIIYKPDSDYDQYRLLCLVGDSKGESFYADDPESLKAKAERLLAEFVSSLGAIFPSSAGLKAERASWPTADELAEMSRYDQEAWERRCAEVEAAETSASVEPAKENDR